MKKVEDKLRAMLEKRIRDSLDRITEESSGGFVRLKPGVKWLDNEEWNKHLKAQLPVVRSAAKAPPKGANVSRQQTMMPVRRARLYVQMDDGRQVEFEWFNPEFKIDVYYGPPYGAATMSGGTLGCSLPQPPADVDIRIGGQPALMREGASSTPFGGPMNVSVGGTDTSRKRMLALLKTLKEDGRPCPACDQSPCAPGCKLTAKLTALEGKP